MWQSYIFRSLSDLFLVRSPWRKKVRSHLEDEEYDIWFVFTEVKFFGLSAHVIALHHAAWAAWLTHRDESVSSVGTSAIPADCTRGTFHHTGRGRSHRLAHLVTWPAPGCSPRVCPPIGLSFSLDLPGPSPAATTAAFKGNDPQLDPCIHLPSAPQFHVFKYPLTWGLVVLSADPYQNN